MREGFSFQAGAGGISLAATVSLAARMRAAGVKASFAHGGATKILVDLLAEGLLGSIVDLQSFDLDAVRSCASNPRHIESDPYASYGPRSAGCVANMLDVAILGATEVDLDFNVNVNTHSDGQLLHGIGGHTDAAASAGCTIITAPSFRKRIPIVRERVTTLTCPGEVVDVIVSERGIAINPSAATSPTGRAGPASPRHARAAHGRRAGHHRRARIPTLRRPSRRPRAVARRHRD